MGSKLYRYVGCDTSWTSSIPFFAFSGRQIRIENLHWTHFGSSRMPNFLMWTAKNLIRLFLDCADAKAKLIFFFFFFRVYMSEGTFLTLQLIFFLH